MFPVYAFLKPSQISSRLSCYMQTDQHNRLLSHTGHISFPLLSTLYSLYLSHHILTPLHPPLSTLCILYLITSNHITSPLIISSHLISSSFLFSHITTYHTMSQEDYVRYCAAYALEHCADDLAYFENVSHNYAVLDFICFGRYHFI